MATRPLLLAAALLAVAAPAAAQQEIVYDVQFNDKVMTALPDTLSVGDRVVLNDRLLIDGAEEGQIGGVCTVTDTDVGYMHCSVTFQFNDGLMSTMFINTPAPEKIFPLFGGAGAYTGLTGTGILMEHGDGTGTLTIQLDE